MELKIGEIFEHEGEWYQCVKGIGCKDCAFLYEDDGEYCEFIGAPICDSNYRKDGAPVIFKKLEKTGKQVRLNGKEAQLIKAVIPCCISCAFFDGKNCEFLKKGITPGCENGAYIEIKQN